MDKHINLIHLNIRNLKCEKCDYKCDTKSRLETHIMSRHTKNPEFKCRYNNCDFVTHINKRLRLHISKIHGPIKFHKLKSKQPILSNIDQKINNGGAEIIL